MGKFTRTRFVVCRQGALCLTKGKRYKIIRHNEEGEAVINCDYGTTHIIDWDPLEMWEAVEEARTPLEDAICAYIDQELRNAN